jgi:hypothetical protein
LADLCCMLLSNITKQPSMALRLLRTDMDKLAGLHLMPLVEVFLRGRTWSIFFWAFGLSHNELNLYIP